MAKNFTNVEIFNSVRSTLSPTWQERIPAMAQDTWNTVGMMITSDQYKTEFNDWLKELVNQIGLTIIRERMFTNHLSRFFYGEMEYGDAIQEIIVDVIKGKDYDPGKCGESIDPFKIACADVKAIYHKVNSQIMYPVTVYPDRAKRAFTSPGGLNRLLDYIVNSVYKSATIDEWLNSKEIFNEYINNPVVPLKPQQIQNVVRPVDEATSKEYIKQVKNIIKSMRYPTRAYNPMDVMTQVTNMSELTLFQRDEIGTTIGVEAISAAFNEKNLSLNVEILDMDNFGGVVAGVDPNPKVLGILADEWFFMITKQLESTDTIWNPEGRYTNVFYHLWKQYGYSAFSNVIILMEA